MKHSPASWPAQVAIIAIEIYQLLARPLLGAACRFEPSCSVYAKDCLKNEGFWRGGFLAVGRILRCHPFAAGGYDPPRRHAQKGPCCG